MTDDTTPTTDGEPDDGPILVLGADGYTGWPFVCRLLDAGYRVHGVDDLSGRTYRGDSVTPLAGHVQRSHAADLAFDGEYSYDVGLDVTSYRGLRASLASIQPTTVVNLAQIPSAPYSMRGADAAWEVHRNNVRGSLNLYWALHELGLDAHVVQLATMGEYGTPETGIPEGFLADGRPAPKEPGSLYHSAKCATTVNTLFLSRLWDVPTTEVYQGIVYGVTTDATERDERLRTRFDCDEAFGTVLNRFTAQAAVDHPLTIYGEGGQKRAMLSLQDCVRCLHLLVENPPSADGPGRHPYRAVNQFDGAHRVRDLAEMVAEETGASYRHVENPRVEDESDHEYDPEREVLDALGYEPARGIREEFRRTFDAVSEHVDRIDEETLSPTTDWRGES